jgi:hypothetical protein
MKLKLIFLMNKKENSHFIEKVKENIIIININK